MLSLWANWLQLNSQLNSPGVSFWLYRRWTKPIRDFFLSTIFTTWHVWHTSGIPKAVSDRDPLRDWVRDLCALTSIATAVPITNRICALCEIIFCSYCADRPMHGFSAHFQNAHARITFRKNFAITKGKISLFRQITIQNALLFAFQKPDWKELCVHKG